MSGEKQLTPEESERELFKALKFNGLSGPQISMFYHSRIQEDVAEEFSQCQEFFFLCL